VPSRERFHCFRVESLVFIQFDFGSGDEDVDQLDVAASGSCTHGGACETLIVWAPLKTNLGGGEGFFPAIMAKCSFRCAEGDRDDAVLDCLHPIVSFSPTVEHTL
jgi:hypothetical protein